MPTTIDSTMPERFFPVGLRGMQHAGDQPREWWLHWILRIAVASTFIGHGAFGIRGKEAWLDYYAIFGIPAGVGTDLMPLTGAVDIALGLLVLVVPMRSVLLYMAFWGLFTATLRPLAGQGVFELVERSYNFGPALALLLLHGWGNSLREWFLPLRSVPRLSRDRARSFALAFRVIIAAYLIAHGALALVMEKALLLDLYGSLGVGDAAALNDVAGLFEIGLGALLLLDRAARTTVLLFVVAWKLGTESLYITHGAPGAGWEVIERGGSYAAPLALICLNSIVERRPPGVANDARGSTHVRHRSIRDRLPGQGEAITSYATRLVRRSPRGGALTRQG
ncbi:MAG TPA: DoxX family protein [Solirubrobacteraceae bacterium]|nr:DoxX family protein [Solirubrobacteraceae bacterium]